MRFVAALGFMALAACLAPAGDRDQSCFVGGCSDEVCSDDPGAISPCIWRAVNQCYRDATCARQHDGQCGWTPTPKLTQCLAMYGR